MYEPPDMRTADEAGREPRATSDMYRLRLRTLVVAVVIGIVGVQLTVFSELVRWGASIDYGLAVLVLLVLAEPLVERLLGLGRKDFLYIYSFAMIATGTYMGVQRFMPVYTAAQYFAAPDNNYAQMAELYPSWFVPQDTELIRQFYEGAVGPIDLSAWLLPMALWTVFFVVLWFTLLCFTSLLRRHWVEDEKLAFPLVTVPLYIAALSADRMCPRSSIVREPLVWVGAGLVTAHFVSIMLHAVNPDVPTLGPSFDVGKFFTEKPLDALRRYFLFVHNPALVGLAYFAPQDLCFSMFSFFFLIKLLMLFYRVSGIPEPSGFPFFWEQAAGAFVAIAGYYAWSGREYLARLWRHLIAGTSAPGAVPDDPEAPFSYRFAAVGALLGFAFVCGWYILAGMTWWVVLIFFALIVLFAVIFTRGRAEAGIGSLSSFPFWQASYQIKSFLGTSALSPGGNYTNLTMLASLIYLHFSSYPETMTYQIESLKISRDARLNSRHMGGLMMLAIAVGMAVMLLVSVRTYYAWGGNSLGLGGGGSQGGYEVRITLQQLSAVSGVMDGNHIAPDWARNGYTIGALLFTVLLVAIRVRYVRFPLHPLGWVMSLPYGYAYWGPFLSAWVAKWVILKVGGVRLYHNLVPFFIGMIVGQIFSVSVLWQIVALFMTDQWRTMADPLSYF